jgi:hypothetical protein
MDEEMAATTPEGAPEWAARGRGVDHVLTVAGLKRVERQQGEGEGGGLTVVLRQYMIGAIAAATTAPRAPDLDMPALPVRSDRSLPPDEPAATTSSPSPPAAPDQPDDAALADTVRINVKHFGDPAPAEPR